MKEAVRRTTKNRGICNFYEKMEENLCLIWMAVNYGQPVPGCVFVEAEAGAGKQRRSTIGYHNT